MVGLNLGVAVASPSPQHLETTGYTCTHFFPNCPFHLITNLWLALFISVIPLSVTSALSPSLNIFMPSVSRSQLVKQLHCRLRTINSQLFWTAWGVSHLTQWLVEETDKWFFYRKMISLGFPLLTFQKQRSSDFSLISLHFFPIWFWFL